MGVTVILSKYCRRGGRVRLCERPQGNWAGSLGNQAAVWGWGGEQPGEEVEGLDRTVNLGGRWEGLPDPVLVWWGWSRGLFVPGRGRKCRRFGLSPGLSFTLDSCHPALEPPPHPGWSAPAEAASHWDWPA